MPVRDGEVELGQWHPIDTGSPPKVGLGRRASITQFEHGMVTVDSELCLCSEGQQCQVLLMNPPDLWGRNNHIQVHVVINFG